LLKLSWLYKIFLFVLVQFFCAHNSFCQKDTLFFDKDWKVINSKAESSFFRTYSKSGNNYLIYDFYADGKIQMTTTSSSINPLNKNGLTVYYNSNGLKSSMGYHENNKPIKRWVWYCEKNNDSSVAVYNNDGTKNYSRICEGEKEGEVFTIVEKMPEFPGGAQEMMGFIQKNIIYPDRARTNKIGGKIFIKFIVNANGDISDVAVIKGSGLRDLDDEARRVIMRMPRWSPGTQNDKPVPVYFNIPINFSLAEPYFLFDVNNTNENYKKVCDLISSGNHNEAYSILNGSNDLKNIPEAVYLLGIIQFNKKEKKDACKSFEKSASTKNETFSGVYNNSQKYLEKYCN